MGGKTITIKKPGTSADKLVEEMVENDSGKAVETKHYVGDEIWNFELFDVANKIFKIILSFLCIYIVYN